MDNTTAEAFANNTAFKSKLKHIDCRQEWVKMLRNKDIIDIAPAHVNTNENLADLFTKILDKNPFLKHRNRIMKFLP